MVQVAQKRKIIESSEYGYATKKVRIILEKIDVNEFQKQLQQVSSSPRA